MPTLDRIAALLSRMAQQSIAQAFAPPKPNRHQRRAQKHQKKVKK